MPSFWNIVVNTIGCSKAFREKKKFTKRGMERLEKDFDILKIIKKVESIAVASFISLSFPQKQIALRLSQRVLSDNNNRSEEDKNYIEKDDLYGKRQPPKGQFLIEFDQFLIYIKLFDINSNLNRNRNPNSNRLIATIRLDG